MNFITPVEITPGTAGSWQDVDVSAYVPAGATGVALHIINASAGLVYTGWRKNGSSDSRTDRVSDTCHFWATIGVDGSRILELYLSTLTDVHVYVVGYFTDDAVFFTNAVNKSLSTTSSWLDIDISSDTGGDTAIGAILEVKQSSATNAWGIRCNGSSDDRSNRGGIYHRGVIIGVDGSEIFEGYINSTLVDFFLNGYILSGSVFNVNATDLSLGFETGYWLDLPAALPSGAIGGYFEIFYGGYDYGLRKNGSSEDIIYGANYIARAIVEADASRLIEGYAGSNLVGFYLNGYPTGGGGGTAYEKNISDGFSISAGIGFAPAKMAIESLSIIENLNSVGGFVRTLSLEAIVANEIIARGTQKIFANLLTLIDSIAKNIGIQKILSEVASLTDSVKRGANRLFSEIINATDTFIKGSARILSEAVNVADIISRQSCRVLNEIMSLGDSLIKTAGRLLTDSLSVLDNINKKIIKTITDIVDIFENVLRTAARVLSDAMSMAENFATATTSYFKKILSETLSIGDALTRQIKKAIAETFDLVESLSIYKNTQKIIADVIDIADNVFKGVKKIYSNSLSLVGSINLLVGFQRILSEVLTVTGAIIRGSKRLLSETIGIFENIIRQAARVLSDIINSADELIIVGVLQKIISEVLSISEQIKRTIGRSAAEVVSMVESLNVVKTTQKILSDGLNLISFLAKTTQKIINENLNIAEFLNRTSVFARILSLESISLAEVIAKKSIKKITDILHLSETIVKIGAFVKSILEFIDITDSLAAVFSKILQDLITVYDSFKKIFIKTLAEAINLTVAIGRAIKKVTLDSVCIIGNAKDDLAKVLSEVLDVADSMLASIVIKKILSEVINIADNILKVISKTIIQVLSIVENISVKAIFQKVLSDSLTVIDNFKKILGKVLHEAVNISAMIGKMIKRSLTEALNIIEAIIKKLATQKIFSEIMTISGNIAHIPAKILSEVVNVTATFSRVVDFIKSLSEKLKIKEGLSKIQIIPHVIKVLVQFLTAKKDIELKGTKEDTNLE